MSEQQLCCTCEYHELGGFEEPCRSCYEHNKWRSKPAPGSRTQRAADLAALLDMLDAGGVAQMAQTLHNLACRVEAQDHAIDDIKEWDRDIGRRVNRLERKCIQPPKIVSSREEMLEATSGFAPSGAWESLSAAAKRTGRIAVLRELLAWEGEVAPSVDGWRALVLRKKLTDMLAEVGEQ